MGLAVQAGLFIFAARQYFKLSCEPPQSEIKLVWVHFLNAVTSGLEMVTWE